MTKDLIYIISELTERGLVKESNYLYSIFRKIAYETTERAEQLFNMANPKGKASENERFMAARNLHNILNDLNKAEFGYKELAKMILDPDNEVNSDSLINEWGEGGWNILTRAETNLLLMLLRNNGESPSGESPSWHAWEADQEYGERRNPRGDRTRGDRRWRDVREEEEARKTESRDKIKRVLESYVGTIQTVTLKRTRGTSDAHVMNVAGDVITFSVPVDSTTLGYKTLHVDDLVADDFIGLNPKIFARREWRA